MAHSVLKRSSTLGHHLCAAADSARSPGMPRNALQPGALISSFGRMKIAHELIRVGSIRICARLRQPRLRPKNPPK